MSRAAAPTVPAWLIALALVAPLTAAGESRAPVAGDPPAPAEVVERRVGSMGTILTLEVEAPTRAGALAASEAAVAAIEATEARLSTWRSDSELARFNRAPAGEPFAVSDHLESELAAALRWSRATDGAFDPALGGLVRAWGLRAGGRVPSAQEQEAAIVPGGALRNLVVGEGRATRLDARVSVEEGGFGKGAGLDAALRALEHTDALRARLDLGGHVAFYRQDAIDGADGVVEIADPSHRARPVVALRVARGSIATSGNSEHGLTIDGRRHGHLLDPRTGAPARDFGSLTVWAADATSADCLSTGLYVLGPERALDFAAAHAEVEVLVIEAAHDGRSLRARASRGFAGRIESLDPRLSLEVSGRAPERAGPEPASYTTTPPPR